MKSLNDPRTMKAFIFNVLLCLFLICCSCNALAVDLGVLGQVYPIQETDLLTFIQKRIEVMQKDGQWTALQNQFRDRVASFADRPQPVFNISKTTEAKSWDFDPSIMVPYDLKDFKGTVFVQAGTRVNPLERITLHNALLFFDADDHDQVVWADTTNKKLSGHTKLILVQGSIQAEEKHFAKQIYFDQEGRLTSHFHIQHVPAMVLQEGTHLKIKEVVP